MERYMVSCRDRNGLQFSSTFDIEKEQNISVLRRGWEEAIRLCGHITAVGSAYVSTIEGKTVGTLR
jgi:hypothetical protein